MTFLFASLLLNYGHYEEEIGNKLYYDCIDDMNSTKDWSMGGMIWHKKKHALACMRNLKNPAYGIENYKQKLKVVTIDIGMNSPTNK